ncbi:hypothetical protein ACWD4L_16230 [Streptomyces sp. NPDC002596]
MTDCRNSRVELLQRAGLDIVGDGWAEDVLPPSAAWHPLAAFDAVPTIAVPQGRPDLVTELNAQWHRLAVEHGVIGGDGVFLIHAAAGTDCDCGPSRWTRVLLTEQWDLAGVLADRPGHPEFVTLSMDGNALLGATSEEYEIWLMAVADVKARLEEEAAAARETPEEYEAAWKAFLRQPGPPERLRTAWIDGLQHNRASPEDVLLRLLEAAPHILWRKLPTAVVDAAVAHPEWKVRSRTAECQPDLTPEQWTRLVLNEPSRARRHLLAELAADKHAQLTGAGYEQLATAAEPSARAEAARLPGLPVRLLTALVADPDPRVRAEVEVWQWWSGSFSYPDRPRGHPNFPRSDLLRYAENPQSRMRQLALDDPESTADLVERFSRDTHEEVRHRAATDPRLSPVSAVRLLNDPRRSVRHAAATHPRLPARTLIRLLRDTATADSAAQNPALPVAVMHYMLDSAATGPASPHGR